MTKQAMRKKNRWLSLILLLSLLLSACTPLTPLPTPQSTNPIPQSTDSPTPTSTPLPFPPPRLLERSPAPGEEQPLDAPLVLTFDQPMDRASVEAAFVLSPTVEGAFTWADERTVAFAPAADWERGARYDVTLAATARNAEGTPLTEPVEFAFRTVGYLTVSQVLPAPDSEEIDPDTAVTVIFDRPVVPLTAINRQAELPQPLTFMPPLRGQGEWLNTSIYVFHPEEGLLPATHYKARVAAGLTDVSGGVLADDFTWEFTTIRPAVLRTWPPEGYRFFGPGETISVTFNQPMDHASVVANFSLLADGEPVEGAVRWRGGETPTDPETMVFTPDEPLPRAADLTALVLEGARAAVGNMTTAETTLWTFATVQEPGIVRTDPRDGERAVDPNSRLRITFASPMQRKGFLQHLTIRPQVTNVYTYWSDYDTEVRIRFRQEPDTTYTVSLDADTPDKYGAPLGQATRIRFTTGDLDPYALLDTGGRLGTVNAYTETIVYAACRNVSRLDLRLYRLDVADFVRLGSSWQAWDEFQPGEQDLIRRWTQPVSARRNEDVRLGLELRDDEGDPLPPGVYYLEMSAPEARSASLDYRPSRFLFVKSRLNLTLKQSRAETLVWATDLASGQPVAGLPVSLYQETMPLGVQGVTGDDGLLLAKGLDNSDLWRAFFAVTGQPGDEGFGLAYNDWDEGLNPWNFNVPSAFYSSDYRGVIYTDRPIYRPDQTVYFKGVLRADDDARYRIPAEIATVEVRIEDPQGKEVYRERLDLNDMGTFHGRLTLDEEAALGLYYLEAQEEAHDLYLSASFQVAEYKKPEFQVSVTTDRDSYLDGDTVAVTAQATYYFGGGVADAAVHWSLLSDDYAFRYTCPAGQSCPYYSWRDYDWGSYEDETYYSGYGRLIAEGDARTDEEGRVTFQVPADLAEGEGSQLFTIEASVTDLNGQQVSNRTAVVVHGGAFYIGVAPRGYLAQVGEEKQVDLLTVDRDGEPLADTPLTVVFMEHHWYSVKRQAEDGGFYWDWTSEDTPVYTTTVTTDAEGRATAAFTPRRGGVYRVRAFGQDAEGREIRSGSYFWVWGGRSRVHWRRESNNRIELIADKDEYQVGDVAEILIPSPYSGTVQALVTVERGRILESQVRELKTSSEVLRLPITEAHVPNIFVSVVIVQGAEQAADGLASFKMGLIKLPVAVEAKELHISLTPDKDMAAGEHYGPRQEATYDLRVTDYEGRPVEAELSLRLADLAVLALADEQGPTLLDTFWRDRGLGVKTSLPLVVALEPLNRELKPRAKGGGGGEGEGGLVRSRFADTAFWDPVVRTDAQGRAQVTVQLPDNLTTWRMQARGVTAETLVGRAEVDILSTLDLLVRPVLPRFFVVGDRAEIATIVHNNTAEALEVEVGIAVEGLTLQGDDAQTVRVPAGDKVKVAWPVEVPAGEQVKVRMWASAGELYDGREDTLPVYRYTTPETTAAAGQLSEPGVRQEVIQLPRDYDGEQGDLTVQLNGSLTAASRDALDYLEHYPYECTEQTVSRFLPNVITWQALEEMGLERPALRQQLAQQVGLALQRLYAWQHYDGGWGWWVNDKSDAYLTAYVLHGLLEARRAGFTVDEEVMADGRSFLRDALPSVDRVKASWQANRLAYEIYVLAEMEQDQTLSYRGGELGLAVRLFEKRHLLSRYGQATLAVALSLLEPEEPQRVQTLLSDLTGDAVVSATGAHWEEAQPDYWNMNTDIRTTAIVIWALARLDPESGLLPNAVRWLMDARREGYWESTQTTAWSLLGLVAYMRASGEMAGDFSYTVYLDGQVWAEGDVSPEHIAESRRLQVEIARLLTGEAASSAGHRLVIERHEPEGGQSGKGVLYYTAHLRLYQPAEQVQALDRGILIARQYTTLEGEYTDTAQVGDVIKVKLTLIAPTDLYYVIVEDPLPAGCEGVDLSLKTTSVVGERPELHNVTAEDEYRWMRWYGWGWWWFSHSEMRDEKVVLFARYLPRGTYEYTYLIRAGVPGEFQVLPATASQMYFPEVFGRSDGGKFIVEK